MTTETDDTFTIKVIIPFRDRGLDPRRTANLETVMTWWWAHGYEPEIVDDGLEGDAQFNRHRAYNRAVSRNADADVFIFTEADMLIPPAQIVSGAQMAQMMPGLVVPFIQYRYLRDEQTGYVRHMLGRIDPRQMADFVDSGEIFTMEPESVMNNGTSIGAVNIVSRETLEMTGGFTERTSGNWYDDRIIEQGFAFLTGKPTRYVEGSAVHLYHLPGWQGDHLTDEDKAATAHNKKIYQDMKDNIRFNFKPAVRELMTYRESH